MLAKKKKQISKLWRPLTWVLYKLKIKPNYITATSVLFAVLGAIYIQTNVVYSMILFALAFFADVLDGALARQYNMITKFGAYFDSCIDRVIELLFIYGVFVYVGQENIAILAAGFSPLISYFKHRADSIIKNPKKRLRHSIFDRAERLIFLIFAFILYFWYPAFSVNLFKIFVLLCVLALFEIFVKAYRRIRNA